MIWVAGRIVPDDALRISVLDRTFEHGLGLFETFRTWNGHPTLLDRHLARLGRSAEELRLPLDPAALPDASAVAALLRADGREGDALLRITLSGGLSETEGSTLWMRSSPLPPPLGPPWPGFNELPGHKSGARRISTDDPLAGHKALNYWERRIAYERAVERGEPDSLGLKAEGLVVLEGSRTNLFMVRDGVLWTPASWQPLLPGIMRGLVLEHARKLGIEVLDDFGFPWTDVRSRASEVFLTNSVRAIIPIARVGSRDLPAPGPVTARLRDAILPWLESGGDAT